MDFDDFCAQWGGADIGVTGSRYGPRDHQRDTLGGAILALHSYGSVRLHHGKAMGVDAFAHMCAYRLRPEMTVTIHPPVNPRWRADKLPLWTGVVEEHPKPFGIRDRDVVISSGVLLAAPLYPVDDPRSARSGSWKTVRIAWAEQVPVYWFDREGNIIDITDQQQFLAGTRTGG